jgi:hypothetical protein
MLKVGESVKFQRGKIHGIYPEGEEKVVIKITRTPGPLNIQKFYENYFGMFLISLKKGIRRDSKENLRYVDWIMIIRDMKRYDHYPADIPRSIFLFFGEFCEVLGMFIGM